MLCRFLKQLNVYTIILTKPTEIQKRGQLGFFGSIYMHVSLFSSMMYFFLFLHGNVTQVCQRSKKTQRMENL